ncbi:MAG TPA: glutaminyl-peptide cyclotransferase [Novosphingobium sp.]|nr:glutaminyl-peptide cyclotransferase [Novosphingobium sp.]
MRRVGRFVALALALLCGAGALAQTDRPAPPGDGLPVVAAQAVRRLPHDPRAYTEGLFIDRGELYESTGMEGRSSLRRVDLATGRVLARRALPRAVFGEGIAPWTGPDGRQILMLTWRNGFGYRFTRDGFADTGHFNYMGEGWGMTGHDGQIVMSDGTATLRFIDPATFRATRLLPVTANGRPVDNLNELEWVDGEIFANVWLTDRIARIDPATGHVTGWIDVSALHRASGAMGPDQVANGIAWDAAHRRLYVTGKEWPAMFEIRLPGQRQTR